MMENNLPRDVLEFREGDMPFSTQFGDHFYCKSDGRAECSHVFLGGNSFPQRWESGGACTIAELGFGTGLNFLETWRQWKEHRKEGALLNFVSFEAFPMTSDIMARSVAAWPEVATEQAALAAHWPTLTDVPGVWHMDDQTTLTVIVADVLDGMHAWSGRADAWFLDGFAPARNPDMWSLELMQEMHRRTNEGGTFASYTAAGWVRRNLAAAGFAVEKTSGFAGKRDMIKGVKASAQPQGNLE
ncbi:tRNA (5-methylaminomethyl-2-thiouridine)(34)-methyltransferase MnmD [Ahrensia marina]|uniref:5-methylaminomethyl-2-thiouridine methyltransferase n=1 Tax=Ahrensia marina TaxID=1514904 RepID=A0A0N0E7R4_9HYPH|nr:tRNA (5-methylaminomethyl-2-thiouridine)(34)-methyltransferase MnmD [Ahrensia marina]KPB01488.1 5-methylaminomethyl-2-thiouridine methyltransferase [Ahrensia marina]